MANFYLTEDLNLNIARGLVKDATPVHVLGYNPDPETVWSYGGVYPWATLSNANTLHVVSSNTGDTANITIIGLNSNFEEITETITLNGTSSVATSNSFIRINNCYYNNHTPNIGDILVKFANSSGTVVDEIRAGYGQNTTGIFTIPDGKIVYLYIGDCSTNLNKECTLVFKIRMYGRSFRVQHIVELSNGSYSYKFPFPSPLPPKTDVEVYVINTLDNNTRVACNFDILLVNTPVGS
jgi:hypothetical protein